ncbi:MAG: kinase [Gammaproteobacteria bacterium]|nr:kinase [Gammaproteobacteria bacterium]
MLAAWIAGRLQGRRLIVGLAGGQGSGKSTLAGLTAAVLGQEFGCRVAVLSLDDLYLPRTERAELARSVHPLFATRGVPGTHDAGLGLALFDQLTGAAGRVALPRFDKGRDERMEAAHWTQVEAPVDVVLFEGWCLGVPPQDVAALAQPCNDLERKEDAEGIWRRTVNDALMGDYAELFARMRALVYLRVPDFAAVLRWREEQEARLRSHAPGAMTPAEVLRFVAHYERLTVALRQAAPGMADLLIDLDAEHRLVAVASGGAWRQRGFRRHSAL